MLDRANEVYLGSAKMPSGGGSGTATGAYSDLTGKPMINGVVIVGNKTSTSFGLQDKLTAGEGIEITADGVISSTATGGTDLTPEQLDAVNSGITAEKVADYDGLSTDINNLSTEVATNKTDIATLKTDIGDIGDSITDLRNDKQDKLTETQLQSVNSGITAEKVSEYDQNLEEFEQLSGEVATLEAEQQTIKSDLGDLGDQVIENNNAIATKNDIFQLSVFPDLNTPNVPNPFQYVGETIGSAIKGHIYEKVETDFTQWERNDDQTYIVTMGGALVGDDVYQADGKTVIGTITDISDDAMTYTDTDGQSVSTTYHSVFHTSGFEEVYTFGDDIDLSDYAKKTEVYTRDNADALFIKNTEKGQANGVATLNSSGVIPSEQVNISSLNVKGTWDASTNTPALVNGVGTSGDFYITSVAGSVDFGAGEINFAVGDWALYTDSGVWEKSVNASAVQSVNGKTGLVNVLDTDVLNEEQLKAVNSGIDEVKVAQIETNKTDIAETKTSLEELSMQVATNTGTIETKLDKTTDVANAGKSLVVDDDGNIGFSEAKGKVFGHVRELGLTTSATLAEITEAMPDGSILMLKVDVMDNPSEYLSIMTGTVTITRYGNGRIQAFMTEKLTGKTWTGIIDSTSNAIVGWKELGGSITYTALEKLGLDSSATIDDVVNALPLGSTALFSVTAFTNYKTMFPYNEGNDDFGRVLFIKGDAEGRIFIKWFRKDGKSEAIGVQSLSDNSFAGWNNILTQKSDPYTCSTYTPLTGTEDLFTLPCGHYVSANINTTYNYPITDTNTTAHIYVLGCLNDPANNKGYRIIFYYDNKGRAYRINEWWGSFSNGWVEVSSKEIIHTDLSGDLAGITTTLNLVNALVTEFRAKNKPVRFVSGNLTKTNLTDLPDNYGVLDITVAGYDVVKISFATSSFGFKQMHYGYVNRISGETLFSSISWGQVDTGAKGLVSNSATFTIDITKRNKSWYCPIKFRYLYGTLVSELDFVLTDKLYYSVSMGVNAVKSITYTVDGANVKIGIEFTDAMYGTQIVSIPSECATINSLTKDAFTGTETAELKLNYKTTYYNLSSMGLTSSATLNDVVVKLPVGGSAILNTIDFTNYQTIFPYEEEQDMYATVKVEKSYDHNGSRTIITWVRKDASKIAYGGMGSNNQVQWWNKVAMDSTPTVTNVSLPSTVTSGSVKYCVKNGVCYVSINALKGSSTTSINVTMPKALMTVSQQVGGLGSGSIKSAVFMSEGNTAMVIGLTTTEISANFSYPVA